MHSGLHYLTLGMLFCGKHWQSEVVKSRGKFLRQRLPLKTGKVSTQGQDERTLGSSVLAVPEHQMPVSCSHVWTTEVYLRGSRCIYLRPGREAGWLGSLHLIGELLHAIDSQLRGRKTVLETPPPPRLGGGSAARSEELMDVFSIQFWHFSKTVLVVYT